MAKAVKKRFEKSKITQKRILDEAYKLFLEFGFAETTVSLISKRVGVSYGTVYTYYNSKSQIFIEIMEDTIKDLYQMARTPFFPKSAQEAYSIIWQQSLAHMMISVTHREIMEIIEEAIHLSPEVREKWQQIREYFFGTITQDIQYGKNAGLVREDINPEISAKAWYAVNEAFLWEILKDSDAYDLPKLAKKISKGYVLGIYNTQEVEDE